MTTTGFILILYVLPMIIMGLIHYFDKTTQTLGDFLYYWWAIFLPFFNIFLAIAFPFAMLVEYVENKNWLQRIKDLKIKSVIIFFCYFLFFSCAKNQDYRPSTWIVDKIENKSNKVSLYFATSTDSVELLLNTRFIDRVGVFEVGDTLIFAKKLKTEKK